MIKLCIANHHRPLETGPSLEFLSSRTFALESNVTSKTKLPEDRQDHSFFREAEIYGQVAKFIYKVFASPLPWW